MGLGGTIVTSGPVVSTDKGDYVPGETVQIRGAGLPSGIPITARVIRPDGVRDSASATADAQATSASAMG